MQASPQLLEIIRSKDFYTVKNVWLPYANRSCDVQVSAQLSDDGNYRKQKEWTGWQPGSGPLVIAVLASLHGQQDVNGVDELKELFAADLKHAVVTSTRITYRPGGTDLVTHDFGTADARSLEAHLVGPDGYLGGAAMDDVAQPLLGEKDSGKVAAVYEWVTGRKPNLFRLNKTPKQDVELALVLGEDIYCDHGLNVIVLDYYWRARGMRVAPTSTPSMALPSPIAR